MREELYDSEDAEPADAAAAREFHLEALREVCDVYAEALTPEQRAGLASVCTLEPCCRRARRRRGSRKRLDDYLAAVINALGEAALRPEEER